MKTTAIAAALALVSASALADNYTIDPSHSYPSIETGHMGISVYRGKFTKTEGKVVLDRAAKTGSAEIAIDAASIDFGLAKLNEHLRSKDFFNVEQFPKIAYKGTAIKFNGDTPVSVEGQLTLLGVTKPVTLSISSFKCIQHPMLKREVCGADASATLDRADFGMKYGLPNFGDNIKLAIQVEAIKAD